MLLIDILVEEHDRILEAAAKLEQMSIALMEHNEFDEAEYAEVSKFIREFGDKTHHMKEEDVLFAEMTKQLGKVAENLIQHGMLVEHNEGRMCVKELEAACSRYTEAPAVQDKLEIISWGMEYVHMIRRHIEKENTVVYPFAERSLDVETWERLNREALEYVPKIG